MKLLSLAFIVLWARFTVLSLAAPLDAPIVVGNQFSQSSPSTVAGISLGRRAQSETPVGPRTPVSRVIWSATGRTWVTAELTAPIAMAAIIPLIRQARAAVRLRISQVGDGLVAGGVFIWQDSLGHSVRMENSNNHQQTLGVIAEALRMLMDFMILNRDQGVGTFAVFDGANEVGRGTIVSTASPLLAMRDLDRRSQFCHNAPATVAGTPFVRRAGPGPVVWCERHTQTYVVIEMGQLVAGASIHKMLDEAFYLVTDLIYTHGDGPLRNGEYFSSLEQTGVHVSNANNHQTTRGVLAAALTALLEYMSLTAFGEAAFTIHDGRNLVGEGFVGLVQGQ